MAVELVVAHYADGGKAPVEVPHIRCHGLQLCRRAGVLGGLAVLGKASGIHHVPAHAVVARGTVGHFPWIHLCVLVVVDKALYLAARQGIETTAFNGVTLLLPKEAGLTELAEQINSAWQKDCSLFFSVEEVPQEEFDARIASGNYTIAFAPIRAEGGSVYQMLRQFTAGGGGLTGYSDELYTARLAESAQQTGSARCQLLAQCERQLLESCTVVPLFAQQKRLLIADGIQGLIFDPFTPVLDVTYATKNN